MNTQWMHDAGRWVAFAVLALVTSQGLRLLASRSQSRGRARVREARVALGLAPEPPRREDRV